MLPDSEFWNPDIQEFFWLYGLNFCLDFNLIVILQKDLKIAASLENRQGRFEDKIANREIDFLYCDMILVAAKKRPG